MWDPQVKQLLNEFRVITYDVRGHGLSEVGDGQYTLEFFVDDLLGLLDFLQVEKAVLCGMSMGGYIVLRAAQRSPERISALVLADTQSKSDSNETKINRSAAIKLVKTKGVEVYDDDFVKGVFAPESFTTKLDVVERAKHMIRSNTPLGICGVLLALAGRTDTTEFLSTIRVPTLIIVGEHDTLTPVSASEDMHARILNSEIHVISRSAHMSNLENPDEFNRHLINFLRNCKKR
jgi:pimeloyl-ACP methyl ester carboxylesterase